MSRMLWLGNKPKSVLSSPVEMSWLMDKPGNYDVLLRRIRTIQPFSMTVHCQMRGGGERIENK